MTEHAGTATATLAGGCFWCLEAVFDNLKGVTAVESGYMGGSRPNPTYAQVCDGNTGHAEVVEVKFNPAKVSYQQVLDSFFELHDPTQLNRQGPDWGAQYRSVIFVHSPEQEAIANATIARLTEQKTYKRPIATQVVRAQTFWRAEEYHQKYLEKRGALSCHI